jgi:trans-L-3-hydroxyproline dehydratase
MSSVFAQWHWQPPARFRRITTVEMHTGGEPLRIFTAGLPELPGETVLQKRRYFRDHYDHIRTATMWEPRGHADMYGAVITPSRDADLDVFFLHNEGYSTMCGHAIIAITTLAFETGLIARTGERRELTINVPAGRIHSAAIMSGERVEQVSFRNVPSFAYKREQRIDVPGLGNVRFDIAYGGAFYAIVDAQQLDLGLEPREFNRLIDFGRRIKQAVMAATSIEHPFESDLGFLYGTIFTGPAQQPGHHSRNVCIFADGEVDRSPTGSGVSARAALHYARGELALDTPITIESILGSTMTVRAVEATQFGPHAAIVPEVSGTAHIIGRNELYLDPDDPLGRGFNFR